MTRNERPESAISKLTPRGLPLPVPSRAAERPWLFVFVWGVCWLGVGLAVGLVVGFANGELLNKPLVVGSILCAEVVGFTALSCSRWIFAYYGSLPYVPRLILQVATLASGGLFSTVVVVVAYPYFALHEPKLILVVGLINVALAIIVGTSLHTFESMKAQIQRSYAELRKKEQMEREMDFAREVQEQLFPKSVPIVRGLDLAGICLPAAGVGGDYYDYLSVSDDSVGLVIADVSGKGISAALLMASLQASVRNVIGPQIDPCEINRRLNDILYRSTTASRYATFFFGLFDGSSSTFRYSNAGHNPPMIVGRNGAIKLSEGGLPLGILDGVRYGEGCRKLEPGDLLLLYTDGAVEATDPGGNEFGLERLIGMVRSHGNSADLGGLIRDTVTALREWTHESPQQDDITLVLARARA